ncbi:MAG: hypothetical protein K2X42_03745, partial [Burkholderiaceae bacterium]|nr:hypothetical protein [Burkholderiaceae bacterium]
MPSQPLMAVGFGRLVNTTTLGQVLDVAVPLAAEAEDQITSACVSAEVTVAEGVLPPPVVHVRLEPSAVATNRLLHVTTTVRIHEPVVNVTVSVACPSRLSRQFVVFVDPPATPSERGAPPSVGSIAIEPAGGASADLSRAAAPVADSRAARPEAAADVAEAPLRPVPGAPVASQMKAESASAVARHPARTLDRKRRRGPVVERHARAVPRLELERRAVGPTAMPVLPAEVAAPGVSAAMASGAASAVTSVDADEVARSQQKNIQSLQQQLDTLQAESDASKASLAQMQRRLDAAEATQATHWVSYVLIVGGAVLLLALGLLMGRRAVGSRIRSPWGNVGEEA